MKNVSTFYISIFLMIVLTVGTPFVSYAQQVLKDGEKTTLSKQETKAESKQLIATAKVVAERDVKTSFGNSERLLWFSTGLGCSVCGVAAAYFADAQPPLDGLLGKSPDYVNTYVDTYESELQKNRMIFAGTGCALSLGIIMVLMSDNSSNISVSSNINTSSDNSESASLEDSILGCLSILDLLEYSLGCLVGDCLVGDCLF